MERYDFHSHFLPKMDDGAKNSDMALEMLSDAVVQGVGVIAATSHYYSNTRSISEYISARDASYARVLKKLEEHRAPHPKMILGAEVYITRGLSLRNDLEKLCYEGTKLILLELPYGSWASWVYREVEQIITNCALKVVLAHPERYIIMPWDRKKMIPFEQMGVIYQLNAEDVLKRKRVICSLLESNCPCVLGSDSHNMSERRSKMKEAGECLTRMYGKKMLLDMENFIKNNWGL